MNRSGVVQAEPSADKPDVTVGARFVGLLVGFFVAMGLAVVSYQSVFGAEDVDEFAFGIELLIFATAVNSIMVLVLTVLILLERGG